MAKGKARQRADRDNFGAQSEAPGSASAVPTSKKKREAPPKAPKVSPASVAAPPAPSHKGGRPKGWKPSEHGKDPGGRPTEWTDQDIEAMADRLIDWAQSHDALYLESFCKRERTYPQKMTEFAAKNAKFSESLKIAKCANAANIGEAVAAGEIPPAVGIFGLKQHGHRENLDLNHSGEVKSHIIQVELPKKA